MTHLLYLNSGALNSSATITNVYYSEQPTLVLDSSLFYPQGGGQKGDIGVLGGVKVLDTQRSGDETLHIVDDITPFKIGQRVEYFIDKTYRVTNSRLHSAGHLIANIAEQLDIGIEPIKGHHWPNEARIEFRGVVQNADDFMQKLAKKLHYYTLRPFAVTTKTLDSGIRVCEIEGFKQTPCGGTHVSSTTELANLKLLKITTKKGVTKISYSV